MGHQVHLVWVTESRYQILTREIAERARVLIRQICEAREVTIVRGAIAVDHIHMLVAAPPQIAPSKLVQYLKGRSSRMLQMEFPQLRKRYWGQHLWARGYFCATVGAVDKRRCGNTSRSSAGPRTRKHSRSPRRRSLEPAPEPGAFRRLEPQGAFQAQQGYRLQPVVVDSGRTKTKTWEPRRVRVSKWSPIKQKTNGSLRAQLDSRTARDLQSCRPTADRKGGLPRFECNEIVRESVKTGMVLPRPRNGGASFLVFLPARHNRGRVLGGGRGKAPEGAHRGRSATKSLVAAEHSAILAPDRRNRIAERRGMAVNPPL